MAMIATYTDAVGLPRRLAAGLIDLAILLPVQIAVWWIVIAVGTTGPVFVIPFILNWGYFSGFWCSASGSTPGKKLLGLKVVSADNGETINWSMAFRRWLGLWGSLLTFGYGFVRIASDPQHEALHDHWARTKVIRSR